MVSETNFVLGIKQTSLHSKEDSHMHTTIWSHTCLSTWFRLHDISQPPWLCVVSKSNKPSKPWLNLSDLHKSKLCLMKPKPQTCSTTSRDQNPEIRSPEALPRASVVSGKSPTYRLRFLTSILCSCTRAIMMAFSSTDLLNLRFRSSSELTRASRIFGIYFTRRWT